ncbi:MAG TPA: hydroxymethylglutaryl-CoA reductase [Vicinamibacteria bacterium]|nr:hydroxymethylglutaryl-CoA reductase [Vicinamibacteria bacterium]
MPISRTIARDRLAAIRRQTEGAFGARLGSRPPCDAPLPPAIPRDREARPARAERLALLAARGAALDVLAGERTVVPPDAFTGNIENFIGMAQVPVGAIGPLRINGLHAHGDFYVPLATTEGALVASHARGAAAIGRSGGARALCLLQRVTRAPLFRFRDLIEAGAFIAHAVDSFPELQARVAETTGHGRLEDVRIHWDGNLVYLLCDFSTGDAAGQNMVTIATDRLAAHLAETAPVRPAYWTVESNLSGDKKASILAYQHVRGHRVLAEVEIPRAVVEDGLHTTPEAMAACGRDALVAASQAGTIGAQGQFANGLTALFLACGQDVACVAEAAVGTSRFEVTADGLYAAVCLPNLIVGTVGGGTSLPTARECLALMGCVGDGTASKLAEIAAVLVLAGEISIGAALASGTFTRAHATLGRKRPSDQRGATCVAK